MRARLGQPVRRHRAGAKRLAADEGLFLIVCGAAPGSRDADALSLLASRNATDNAEGTAIRHA